MLVKDFNLKQPEGMNWLEPFVIENKSTFDLMEFKNANCIVGVDLAVTTDLCCASFLFKKLNDNTNYIHQHFWIPSSKLTNSDDNVNYREWQRQGYLTITESNDIDVSIVADYIYTLYRDYGIIPLFLGYDNRFAKEFLKKYHEWFGTGASVICVNQNPESLNNPMRTAEQDFRHKLINYNNNPISFWNFCNTGIKIDKHERIIPHKMATTKRIDGTAGLLNCYFVYATNKSDFLY